MLLIAASPKLDPRIVEQLQALPAEDGSDAFATLAELFVSDVGGRLRQIETAQLASDRAALKA